MSVRRLALRIVRPELEDSVLELLSIAGWYVQVEASTQEKGS
jgi:hypothetical protein